MSGLRSSHHLPMSLFGRLPYRAVRQWNRVRTPLPAVVTALLCFILVGLCLIGAADWSPEPVQPAPAGLKTDAQRRLSLLSSNRLVPALPLEELRFVDASEGNGFRARGRHYSVLVQAAEATLIAAAPASALLRLRFVGANPSGIAVHGAKPLPGLVHTIKGRDPGGWRTGLKGFAEVIAQGVYPGIDVLYKGRNGHLEYDFLLAPGADPAQIRLQFEGFTDLSLTPQGDLQLQTPFGLLRQPKPVIYQMDRGRRMAVAGGYRLLAGNRIGFEVHGYRPDQPLIIDPLLDLATTLGGEAADSGHAVAIDPAGYLYIAGITRSADFPIAAAIQPELNGGRDLFIAKLSADGSSLVYVTYLGGSAIDGIVDDDSRLALAVDRQLRIGECFT